MPFGGAVSDDAEDRREVCFGTRHQCLSAERSATTSGRWETPIVQAGSPVPFGGAVSDDKPAAAQETLINELSHQCLSAERSATTLVRLKVYSRGIGHQCLSAERSATTV